MADRLSQETVEVLYGTTGAKARLSQEVVEVVYGTTGAQARVSQIAVETLIKFTKNARVSQVAVEVLQRSPTQISLTLAGSSSLNTTVRELHRITLSLAGTSSLSASLGGLQRFSLTLAGTSSLSVSLREFHRISLTLAGTSSLAANLRGLRLIGLTLAGTSSLVAAVSTAEIFDDFTLTLAGTSSLSTLVGVPRPITLRLDGTSSLSAAISGVAGNIHLLLQGIGQLLFGFNAPIDITLVLAGTSSLTAGVAVPSDIHLTLAGTSSLIARLDHVQFTLSLRGFGYLTFPTGVETQTVEVTQVAVEVMATGEPEVKASQITLEALAYPDRSLADSQTRLSQVTLEVLRPFSSVRIHIRYPVSVKDGTSPLPAPPPQSSGIGVVLTGSSELGNTPSSGHVPISTALHGASSFQPRVADIGTQVVQPTFAGHSTLTTSLGGVMREIVLTLHGS